MAKYGLIGYPAAGSLSPALFAAAYGGRYPYEIIEEEDFDLAFRLFMHEDYRAVNITAPHKMKAADAADWRSPEVERTGAANILVKTPDGLVEAYNSDVAAVRMLMGGLDIRSAMVVGLGGAGRAALAAALGAGLKTSVRRHNELGSLHSLCSVEMTKEAVISSEAEGEVEKSLVIYTLPRAVPGIENIRCRYLIEANYIDPACENLPGVDHYISGKLWLKAQAIKGYGLMTGEVPDAEAIEKVNI
ncbi:MAG: hypothetical protein J5667_04925 [Bacteroidales bacterium]|nr:hypothetical protein [Bacteroidales bacterium]